MGTMAVIWLEVVLFERVGSFPTQTESQRRFLVLSVVTAGLMLGASLGIALIGGIGFEVGTLPKRVLGIMIGLVLVVIGNTVPKVPRPARGKTLFPRPSAIRAKICRLDVYDRRTGLHGCVDLRGDSTS
jgi:hypothetical protein